MDQDSRPCEHTAFAVVHGVGGAEHSLDPAPRSAPVLAPSLGLVVREPAGGIDARGVLPRGMGKGERDIVIVR